MDIGKDKRKKKKTLQRNESRDSWASVGKQLKGRLYSSCNSCEGDDDDLFRLGNRYSKQGGAWERIQGNDGGREGHRSRSGSGGGSRNRREKEMGVWRVGWFCEEEKEKVPSAFGVKNAR